MFITRAHTATIALNASAQQVFDALITPGAIRRWWGADRVIVLPQREGGWSAAWGPEESPEYIITARVGVFDPPRRLLLDRYHYLARTGPLPFKADFSIEFRIDPVDEHSCQLRLKQDGFPQESEADDFFHACEKGWAETLGNLKQFVETPR